MMSDDGYDQVKKELNLIQKLELGLHDYVILAYDEVTDQLCSCISVAKFEKTEEELQELANDTNCYYVMMQVTNLQVPARRH